MQIAICDDQKLYRDDILKRLQDAFVGESLHFECFDSGEELLRSDVVSDFLFLDIEMGEIDGIQVKEILEKQALKTRIINGRDKLSLIKQLYLRIPENERLVASKEYFEMYGSLIDEEETSL